MKKTRNRSVVIALLNLLAVVASQTALARHFNLQESNSAEFYHELGLEHFRSSRYEEAIEAFATAVQLKPTWAEAYNDLGMSYSSIKRLPDAVECFKRAVSL